MQKMAVCAPSHNFVWLYLATKAHIDNRKNLLNSNISSTCPHNVVDVGLLAAEIGSGVWWVSRLGSVTASTSHNGGQPNFARCLAVSWAGNYTFSLEGSCPLTEFCQVQNPLCVQV